MVLAFPLTGKSFILGTLGGVMKKLYVGLSYWAWFMGLCI